MDRVNTQHHLVAKQLSLATEASGEVNHSLLCELMSRCYEEMELDRRRVDRANELMQEELTELTHELERMSDSTRVQNARFQAALDHMSQGLCLLDAQGHLAVGNRRFLRMFDLSDEVATAGRLISEVFGASTALADAGEYISLASAPQPGALRLHLKDGRIIQVAHEPMEGGGCVDTFEDITEGEQANIRLLFATEAGNIGLWDAQLPNGPIWFSAQFATMLGYDPKELPGKLEAVIEAWVHPEDGARLHAAFMEYLVGPRTDFDFEFRMRCKDGSWRWIQSKGRIVERTTRGRARRIAGVHIDVTERKETERRLASSERLESVGRLAAGVAHEINTPVQFVSDNVQFVNTSMTEIGSVIQAYRRLRHAVESGGSDPGDTARAAAVAERAVDLDYLLENVPLAIGSASEGLGRIATIVRSMKEFAHPDQEQKSYSDLNRAIQSTLVIAHNEYKYVAELETHYGDLPPVLCHVGEINQVILNLLVNASHAIGDAVKGTLDLGKLTVRTRRDGDQIEISIQDTGTGIPDTVRNKVFDPFFTTKPVGQGTGQGLAIAHGVIVKKHGGTLRFDTEFGMGTTFYIRLPINDPASLDEQRGVA
jgi:PAS domain S-box-containing protein